MHLSQFPPSLLSFSPSLSPSIPPSNPLSVSSSLSGQRFTIAPFLHLFIHTTLLIGIDLRPPTKNLQVTVVVLRGYRWFGSPCQIAQEMTQGFSDNGMRAGTVVLCHGNHLLCITARNTVLLVSRDYQRTVWSMSSPKGAARSPIIHPNSHF